MPATLARPQCKHKKAALPKLQAPGVKKTAGLGQCPVGWTLAHTVPSLDVARRSGTQTGVTTCINRKFPGARWVHIKLPEVMKPALAAVDVSMRILDGRSTNLPDRPALACGCDELIPQRTSDTGDRTWLIACDKLKIDVGVAFVRPDGTMSKLVLLD